MEQKDSLKAELQNLTRLQGEQVNILKDMSGKQTEQATLSQASQAHQQANFNTPGMYQNSAPMYGNPFGTTPMNSPYGNPYGANYSNMFRAMGGQRFGMMDVLSPNSQMSLTSRTLTSMDQGSRLAQAGLAATGAAASGVASWGLGAMLPGFAGIGAGIVGGVAAGAFVGMSSEEIKKNSALKKYIYKNSSQFINSFESENDRGVAGFSREQSEDAANFVRTMNDEFYMGDDDTMMLLQKFTEGGLLKESKDLDSFKDKMKTLTKTVKEGALMLNETYDSIADLMAEMRAAGMDQKNFSDIMGSGATLGSLFGLDGADVLKDFIDFIKNLNAGTGNDSDKTFDRLEDTSIYISEWYDKLKGQDKDKLNFTDSQNLNMIDNLGGPEAASKYTLSLMEKMVEKSQFKETGLYFYDYDEKSKEFKFNDKNFKEFLDKDISLQDMYQISTQKKNQLTSSGNGNAVTLWENQFSAYYKDNLKDGDLADYISKVLGAYTNDPNLKAQGYDERGILNMMGVTDASNQNLLTGFLDFKNDNPKLAGQVKLQNIWQQQTAGKIAETPTLTEYLKSGFEKVKDNVTQGFVDFDNTVGSAIQGIQDWWTGYKPIPKFDQTFTTSSKIKSIAYEEVSENTKRTGELLASGYDNLTDLKKKGYEVDNEIYKFVKDKFNKVDNTVEYGRDLITNWDDLSEGIKQNKDEISKISEKNDLSETIVAALFKYNQQKPDNEKIDITTTTDKLGDQLFQYGGNTNLALAATLEGSGTVDKALEKLGYKVDEIRSMGGQNTFKDIDLSSLGLDDKIINKIEDIINQNLTDSKPVTPQGLPGKEDLKNQDLGTKSNLTAEDLDKFIEENTANKPNSLLKGMGQTIMDAANETGLDPAYLLSHAAAETAWGTSAISNDKYNWFGIGAYNSSPYESAYKFEDKSQGLIEGARWIKDNYYSAGQNTVNGMIGVPGHNYAVNDDGSPNLDWANLIPSIMLEVLNSAGKGYEDVEQNEEKNKVETTTETVVKDKNGKVLTKEEIAASEKETWAEEGFSGQLLSGEYKKMNQFLDIVDVVDKLKTETPEEREQRLNDTIIDAGKDGKLVEWSKFAALGSDYIPAPQTLLNDSSKQLVELLDKALAGNVYGGVDDALSKDEDLKKTVLDILSLFKDEKDGQDYVNNIVDEKRITTEGPADGLGRYETAQAFGEILLGLDKEQLAINSGDYNQRLNYGLNNFYESGLGMLQGFLGGDKESQGYKAWAEKSAAEQEALIETFKKIEYALGLDGENSGVNEALDGKSRDDIHTEEDNYKKNFLHKDAQGNTYYDESKGENPNATWDDFNDWVEGGEKRFNYGSIKKGLGAENITTTNENGKSISMQDLLERAVDGMNSLSEQQNNVINGEGKTAVQNLITGRENIIGRSNSEIEDRNNAYNANDQDGINLAENNYNKFLERVGQMVQSGDASGLRELQETETKNGRTFNTEEFNKLIDLAEKINKMDASNLSNIVEQIKEIIAQTEDMVSTTALFIGADGKGEDGLGEGFARDFSEQLIGSISEIFKGSDFGNKVASGEYDTVKILELLQNGGVDTKTDEVVLSTESVEIMVNAMAKAMNETFEKRLETVEGIQEFRESDLYKDAKDSIVIDIGGGEMNVDEALSKIEGLANGTIEATDKALEDKALIIEKVRTAFEEQVDEAGALAGDAEKKLNEANSNSSKTISEFSTALEEYDSAIQTAIKTFGSSVVKVNESVGDVDTKLQNHLNWHSLGSTIKNWFSGDSSGDSVNPNE